MSGYPLCPYSASRAHVQRDEPIRAEEPIFITPQLLSQDKLPPVQRDEPIQRKKPIFITPQYLSQEELFHWLPVARVSPSYAYLVDMSSSSGRPVLALKKEKQKLKKLRNCKFPKQAKVEAAKNEATMLQSMPLSRAAPPIASDSDWDRRHQHRIAGVGYVKSTAQYINYGDGRPKTPDPMDRSLSKREWEKSVQLWRSALAAQ